MKVLLLTIWKPNRGGIVTHVENLMEISENDFDIIAYPPWAQGPVLRPLGFLAAGLLVGARKDFDIIHAHYTLPQGLLGVFLGYLKRRPVILTVHGSDVLVLGKKGWAKPLLGWVLYRCDRIIAVSKYLKTEVVKLGFDGDKIAVVHGGVKPPQEPVKHDRNGYTITFIGALVKQKGTDILLRAFEKIRANIPDARLLVVGDGPERRALEGRGTDGVEFLGFVDDLEPVFAQTDVLVQPSRQEGFGLTILEAMAKGIPVVAANVGGIPEVLGPDYGTMVPPEDEATLAREVLRVLGDRELRKELTKKGLERSRGFSWRKMAEEVDRIYEEALG